MVEYLLECIKDLAELFDKRYRSAKSYNQSISNLIKKFWGLRVTLCDQLLNGHLSKAKESRFQKKKATTFITKSVSLKNAFFDSNSELHSLESIRNDITDGLLNCCQISGHNDGDNNQMIAATELWNFYQRYYKEQTNVFWASIFQKLYSYLVEATNLKDYSLFKYVAATHALMLLQEVAVPQNVKEPNKPKAGKANAPPNSLQAEEIINNALHKTPYLVESQIFLVAVWRQMLVTKADKCVESISNIDDLTELFTSLELAELSSEKFEGLKTDYLLKRMVFTALTSNNLPEVLKIEIMAGIAQFAVNHDYFTTASGCLNAGFEVITSSKHINCQLLEVSFFFFYSKAKMLLELVKSQYLIILLTKNIYEESESSMLSEAFDLSLSSLHFGLQSPANIPFAMFFKLFENIEYIIKKIHGLKSSLEYFVKIRKLFSSFKKWPKIDTLLQSSNFFKHFESVFVLLSEICFANGWNDDGISVCDLSDKIISKSDAMNLERYKWLSWTGKQSCFLKLLPAEVTRMWLRQTQNCADYNIKMRVFELCMKESQGSKVELESIVCFLEWKIRSYNIDKFQMYWNRLKDTLDTETVPKLSNGLELMIINLRAAIIVLLKERNDDQIQKLLKYCISIVLELIQSTQIESLLLAPPTEAQQVLAKVKKDAKDVTGIKSPPNSLPKELHEWMEYVWPEYIQSCFNECNKNGVFCLSQLANLSELIGSLFRLSTHLNKLGLHGSVFLFTKLISLISSGKSKEILCSIALIEVDALLSMNKIADSTAAFRSFYKNKLDNFNGQKENQSLYPRSLFLQGGILLKYGHSVEAKRILLQARNLAVLDGDLNHVAEIDILLGFLNIIFGNMILTQKMMEVAILNSASACMLMDSSLTLLFSEAICSQFVKADTYFFIESVINQIDNIKHETLSEDVNEALFTLNWIQLRLLSHIEELAGQQRFKLCTKLYENCTHYGEKNVDISRFNNMQCDYIDQLWNLLKEESDNKNKRQIRNHCIEFIKNLESKLEKSDKPFDSYDFKIILAILKIELDHLAQPNIEQHTKNVDDILDEYLVNITDPPLQIPDTCCKLLYDDKNMEIEGKITYFDMK